MAEDLQKLKFPCPHCGRKLRVPADRAGQRGKCPRCKKPLTVPVTPPPSGGIAAEGGRATSPDSNPDELVLIPPVLDGALLDLPHTETQEPEPDESQETYERLRGLEGRYRLQDEEELPQRRLPWIFDIFLYPLNTAGLTMLGITVGIPLILRLLLFVIMAVSMLFPPAMVFWVLILLVNYAGMFLLVLYMNWYACECIRDSAGGGIRAVDTTASTPGLGDILAQTFRTLVCVLACVAPTLIYYQQTRQVDAIFWTLSGVGGFLLPMSLLAVTMFESLQALNPLLLAGSILSTLLPYCVLVPFCYIMFLLLPVAFYVVKVNWIPGYPLLFVTYYVWLILAHLLGRFRWKYEEQLNWEA